MKVLVTGADGFIGKNLCVQLAEKKIEVIHYVRNSMVVELEQAVLTVDFVFHLAGINRPQHESEFQVGNVELTKSLCAAIQKSGRTVPVLLSSSTQAELANLYGQSKLAAEQHLLEFHQKTGNPIYLYRLPGVFGKWCKPNYNSVVATFCHNITRGLPIQVNDPSRQLTLVHVDDVVRVFIDTFQNLPMVTQQYLNINPVYSITLGDLASQLQAFWDDRAKLFIDRVGTGLTRALYSTLVSYYPLEQFSYKIPKYEDPRGEFVEMLKTKDAGQMSFFSAPPGATRGEHYHHTKTEKFLVVRGEALFRFRHIVTQEFFEHKTTGKIPEIVETIPGYAHDITNVGNTEMIVMLWANEVFDRARPDTISNKVKPE